MIMVRGRHSLKMKKAGSRARLDSLSLNPGGIQILRESEGMWSMRVISGRRSVVGSELEPSSHSQRSIN